MIIKGLKKTLNTFNKARGTSLYYINLNKLVFWGILVILNIYYTSCKSKYIGVLNRHYGQLAHTYLNTEYDFSISLNSSEKFLLRPSIRDLSRNQVSYDLIRSLKKGNVLYFQETSFNRYQLGIVYLNSKKNKFLDQYISAFKLSENIKGFREINTLIIPSSISKYYPKVYEYSYLSDRSLIKVIDVLFFTQSLSKVYRFTYLYSSDVNHSSSPLYWENRIYDELATFKDSLSKKMEQRFLQSPILLGFDLFKESNRNYLTPLWGLKKFANINKKDPELIDSYKYSNSLFYSFAGDIINSRKFAGLRMANIENPLLDTAITSYRAEYAIDQMGKISQKHNIIMINESHLNPYCRVFASSVLDTLYKNGFRYMFVETLGGDSLLNGRKYPIQQSGVYTSEPMFGNFIRKALQLGFKILPYECEFDCNGKEERDKQQAENIAKQLPNIQDKKVLVYAGHNHIYKRYKNGRTMAQYFQEITGVTPFCIDQSINDEIWPSQDYSNILTKHKYDQSVMLFDSLRSSYWVPKNLQDAVDAVVIHPPVKFINGKYANWLLNQGNIKCDINLIGDKYKGALLQIMIQKESSQARAEVPIPTLNLILEDNNQFSIYLNKGEYYLTVYNTNRERLFFKEIKL